MEDDAEGEGDNAEEATDGAEGAADDVNEPPVYPDSTPIDSTYYLDGPSEFGDGEDANFPEEDNVFIGMPVKHRNQTPHEDLKVDHLDENEVCVH